MCRTARRTFFGSGARKLGRPSGMRVNRIELVFLDRPVTPSELHRHIVKPAGREAAIEMPQSGNDHSDDRNLDVRPRLIEDEEIEARLLRQRDAGGQPARACRDGRTSRRSPAAPPERRSASNRDDPRSRNGIDAVEA